MQDAPSAPESPSVPPPSDPGPASPNRTIMIVLAYMGILALIPLLVEKEDAQVQWHAKHGIVLAVSWMILWVALMIFTAIPVLGWVVGCGLMPILWLLVLVIHIVAIVKGVKGERLRLPVLTDYADRWQ